MDLYGHNPFTNYKDRLPATEAVEFPQLTDLQTSVRRYLGRKVGIWLSEFTIPTAPDIEFNFWVEYRVQASWLKRSLKIAKSLPSVKSFGWLYLYDSPVNDKGDSNSGGLITLDGKRKPAYYTFKRG
jgi:hypothetical protein